MSGMADSILSGPLITLYGSLTTLFQMGVMLLCGQPSGYLAINCLTDAYILVNDPTNYSNIGSSGDL